MNNIDLDFEAMKDVTRLAWLVNFEAVATAGNDDDADSSGPRKPN
jgi:hypothetical protein